MILTQVKSKRYAQYAWFLLGYTILIILIGAFVRASGSGAGCGSNWPTCNGEVIPRPERIETVIEFTHRLTSGLMGILIIIMVAWSQRIYGWRHGATRMAAWTLFFTIVEGGIGAGLVKFELVADNASTERAYALGAHLINTLWLLWVQALATWYASGGRPLQWRGKNRQLAYLGAGFLFLMIVGAAGAVTALGDTLFPAETFLEGTAAKFDPDAHFTVKARLWHPTIAILTSAYLLAIFYLLPLFKDDQASRFWRHLCGGLIVLQVVAGTLNVLLAVPIWMQLVHLLLADLLWIALTFVMAVVLQEADRSE